MLCTNNSVPTTSALFPEDVIEIKGVWQKLGFTMEQLQEARSYVSLYKTDKNSRTFLQNLQALFGNHASLFLKLVKYIYSDQKPKTPANIKISLLQNSTFEAGGVPPDIDEDLQLENCQKRKRSDDNVPSKRLKTGNEAANSVSRVVKLAEESHWEEIKAILGQEVVNLESSNISSLSLSSRVELLKLLIDVYSEKHRSSTARRPQVRAEITKNQTRLREVIFNILEYDAQIKELERKKMELAKEAMASQAEWEALTTTEADMTHEIEALGDVLSHTEQLKFSLETKLSQLNSKLAIGLETIPAQDVPALLDAIGFAELIPSLGHFSGSDLASLASQTKDVEIEPFITKKKFLYLIQQIQKNKSVVIPKVGGPADWDVQYAARWFHSLGFPSFSQLVLKFQIPGSVLISLTLIDLLRLGVDAQDSSQIAAELERLRSHQSLKEREYLVEKNLQLKEKLMELEKQTYLQKERLDKLEQNSGHPKVPAGFVCCITGSPMREPVIAADGFTYERSAIEQWYSQKKTSPMTNLPVSSTFLVPNRTLRSMIMDFYGGKMP